MASTPGIVRSLATVDAQHDPRSSAHGKVMIDYAVGKLRALQANYSDDPALAAEDALEALEFVLPVLYKLRLWAEDVAHQSFTPAPVQGARID